jgi:hypothetical protein
METENKYCEYCKKNINSSKWLKHTYLKKHRNNFRLIHNKPLQINQTDINIQNIKIDLFNLSEDLNNIINKIKTLEKIN